MAQQPTRQIWKIVLTNFINSFKPRQTKGNYMGADVFGNKFYEIPVNSVSARTRPSRWFDPPVKDDFQNEMSSEWESWLRGKKICSLFSEYWFLLDLIFPTLTLWSVAPNSS